MPNWCNNSLTIDAEYRNKIINKDEEVDFNIVLPMPESLYVESGSSNDFDMYIYLSDKMLKSLDEVRKNPLSNLIENQFSKDWLKEISERVMEYAKENPDRIELSYQRGSILINNYKNYGAITWYEWCNKVWGVKWNASDSYIENESIEFNTPWGPPVGWLEKLASLGIPFILKWEEESGCYGTYVSDGKTLIEIESGIIDYDEYEEE